MKKIQEICLIYFTLNEVMDRHKNRQQYYEFDTEDADSKNIKVGENEILLTEKDDNYILSRSQNEKSYTLYKNMPKKELLKIE